MTSFYAQSFEYFSNKPESVCAFLATNRSIFNSSIIPVTLNIKDLWEGLRNAILSSESSLLALFLLSDTLQFAPSLRLSDSVDNALQMQVLTTLIKERRYFCRTLKHFTTNDRECAALICENVKSLQSVALSTGYVTNRSLTAISKLTSLTDLKLRGQFYFAQDEALKHLSSLTGLVKLDLSFCSGLRGRDLLHLETMKLLRELNLKFVKCLSDADFLQLPVFTALEFLDISNTNIGDRGIVAVAKQTALRTLEMRVCSSVTVAGFQLLFESLHELLDLDLGSNSQIDDSCLFALSKGSYSLRRLSLNGSSEITDSGVVGLFSEMIDLEALDISLCDNLTNVSLEAISKLNRLTELDIRFTSNFLVSGLEQLQKLPRLQKLSLSKSGITSTLDKIMSEISKFKSLRFLYINMDSQSRSTKLVVAQLQKLAAAPSLEKVKIWNIPEEMFNDIQQKMSSLTQMHFPFTLIFHDNYSFAHPLYVPR